MDREPDWPLSWFLIPKDLPGARWLVRHWRSCQLASLLLLLLICGALISMVSLLSESELPARAQLRLDEYLAYAFPGEGITVAAIDRATYPSRLTADLAGPAFGSSLHFQTDLGASDLDDGSLSPLPFPPAEVWCVLLKGEERTLNCADACRRDISVLCRKIRGVISYVLKSCP